MRVVDNKHLTVEQYGLVARLSDLAELTAAHNIIEKTIYVLGLHSAELYDQLIFNVVDAATNVYRPNSRAGDTSLLASDRVGYTDLVSLLALHQDQGARPFDGGSYVFVTPPQVNGGLLLDSDFKAANQFGNADKIFRGQVGQLANLSVVVSNAPGFAATSQATSGKANKVYSSFIVGRYAYQVTDLQNIRTYVVAPGGHTDPLQQSRKLGYKFAFKSKITNENWIRRVRSAGLNSVNNP